MLISHALLDTLTDGGLGCALLWPFDRSRYFAPWNPIPVAPIGWSFLTPYGLFVSVIELALFGPLLWFVLTSSRARTSSSMSRGRWRGRRSQTLLLGGWVVVVWLITSRDPFRQGVVALALRDDTIYAARFSERAFRDVKPGQDPREVRDRLGTPLREFVHYPPAAQTGCFEVWFEANQVVTARDPEGCRTAGISLGTSRSDVLRLLGEPGDFCWTYTWSPSGGFFRARVVCFVSDKVRDVIAQWIRLPPELVRPSPSSFQSGV